MYPPAKLIAAVAILLVGGSLALLFRRDAADDPTITVPLESLTRREPDSPVVMEIAPPFPRPAQVTAPPAAAQASATELFARNPATPRIANDYPGPAAPFATETSPPALPPGPMIAVAQPVKHKIVDGDTLASLALHYLGDVKRQQEIFEANRQVLSDPELLPIGAKLRIPPR